MSYTVWTPLPQLQSAFPALSLPKLQKAIADFKKYDTNKDGSLDQLEVKYMLEQIGETKTHLELMELIAEVNAGKDFISFEAFLQMVAGGVGLGNTALGRIYQSKLASLASFHESEIRKAAGPPQKTQAQIEEEKLERKLKASQARAKMRAQAAK